MHPLQTASQLARDSLDNARYFESLLERAASLDLIDVSAVTQRVQRLIVRQMEIYVAGRSASISESAAHRIGESTLFTLGLRLKAVPEPINALALLQNASIDDLYSEGRSLADQLFRHTELAYTLERARTSETGNECFDGTFFTALPAFFAAYNPEFSAAEVHITADYPVLYAARNLRGIEFIADYLTQWQTENRFLRLLPEPFTRKSAALYAARAGLNYSELEENLFLIALAALISPEKNECARLLDQLNCDSPAVRDYIAKTADTHKTEWVRMQTAIQNA